MSARGTLPFVAFGLAQVPARQLFVASSLAMGYGILAGLSRLFQKLFQRSLAARAVGDHVRGEGAMTRDLVLCMASLKTLVGAAIKVSGADLIAGERGLEPRRFRRIEGLLHITLLIAEQLLLNTPTVAFGVDEQFALTTKPRMTGFVTNMRTTW